MIWWLACRSPEETPPERPIVPELPVSDSAPAPLGPPHDVLILVTDDQGTDKVGVYAEHPVPPPTPNIDALAERGVLFRHAYASPVCSPTRASVLTGRMPRRTGVGDVIQAYMDLELQLEEVLLPERLADADRPWASAAFGKWHLAGFGSRSGRSHANAQGFEQFAGTVGNLYDTRFPRSDYYSWEKVTDGVAIREDRYATTVTVDDALEAIETLPEPWLVYVGFHAPHEPLDPPPAELCPTFGALPGNAPKPVLYHAMVEALDTEIGRLLEAVDLDRTTVIFLSDNGTPGHAVLPPLDPKRAKITNFEGGVRVPMIVAGPLVAEPGTETDAFVHAVDVFSTVAEIAGVEAGEVDGYSLVPLLAGEPGPRSVVHTERFTPVGPVPDDGYFLDIRTTRDESFKVIELAHSGNFGFFDVRDGLDDGLWLPAAAFGGDDRVHVDALLAEHLAYWETLTP